MKFKQILFSAIISILGLSMTSCDPSSEYVYIISNRSSENIYLVFYPQDWVEEALETGNLYWNYNGVYLIGNGSEKIDWYKSPFELKPGESLKFSDIIECSAYIQKNPEDDDSRPLWHKDYYIDQILVGEDFDKAQKEITEEYWSSRANWHQQNKKTRYAEYWLIIDDEVVNNNATNNNHR